MNYWRLHSPSEEEKLAQWDESVHSEKVECAVHSGHQRSGKRMTDLAVVLPSQKVEDFVWTWISDCLIQDYVLDFFKECNFSGFYVKPVRARFSSKVRRFSPKLWELRISGWGGVANPESGISLDEARSCSACGMLRYTPLLYPENLMDEKQWDGSDFFIVWPLTRFIFVTDRVIEAIKKKGFNGVQTTPMENIESTGIVIGPERLRNSMPDKRAHELGDPLGIY